MNDSFENDKKQMNELNKLSKKQQDDLEKMAKESFKYTVEPFKKLIDDNDKASKKLIKDFLKNDEEIRKNEKPFFIGVDPRVQEKTEERKREKLKIDNLEKISNALDKQKEDSKIIKKWTIFSAICIFLTLVATIYLIGLSQCENTAKETATKSSIAEIKISKDKPELKGDKSNNKQTDDRKPEFKSKP